MNDTKNDTKFIWINERRVSDITDRALSTLRNDRSLGRGIPYSKLNNKSVRYRLSDVIAHMEKHRVETSG